MATTGAQQGTDNSDHPDKELIKKWLKRIEVARKTPEYKAYLADIEKHRRYVKGDIGKDGETTEKAKVNLVYATLAGLLPHIYAKNPEMDTRPSEAVDEQQYPLVKAFAKTLEIILNKQFDDAKLKKRGKATVRAAMTTPIGWVKVIFQQDIARDPLIQNRINDIQDNLRCIEELRSDDDDDQSEDEKESNAAELREQLKALEKQVEVMVAEGLVIDRPLSEDMTWDTCAVRDFDNICNSDWLAERIWFSKEKYEEVFGKPPSGKAATYKNRTSEEPNTTATSSEESVFYAVHEIWHKASNTIYTVCEGAEEWSRDPYQLDTVGERWYPYFPLGLHPIDGTSVPLSTVGFLTGLEDEYHQIRKDEEEFRKANIPHYIAGIDAKEGDIQRKQVAGIGEVVILDSNGQPIDNVIKRQEMLRVDPMQYDTNHVRADIDFMSGLPDAARGGVVKAKTATEADYLQAGLASRTDEMQDQIEDWFREIAVYSAEVLLQELTPVHATRLAGQGAVWPTMAKEQIFESINIDIRAGSSGKPNKMQELKNWADFLPGLRDTFQAVAELREKGDTQTADVLVNIARETLRRMDDRIDIEEFMPQEKQQGPSQQEMEAMQAELEKTRAELALLQGQAHKAHAEAVQTDVETKLMAGQAVVSAVASQAAGTMLQ